MPEGKVKAKKAAIGGGVIVFLIVTVANILLSPPLGVVDHLRNAFFAVLAAVFVYRVVGRSVPPRSTSGVDV